MPELNSLWGDEFELPKKETTKKVLEKIKKPKKESTVNPELSVEKQIKSKKIDIKDRLILIKAEVERVLGSQKDTTTIIKDKQTLVDYISKSIENGIIAIDTETNNSVDPLTCKLMGGCIYTPGLYQAYIPINHIDLETRERLDWQLTEQDIKEQFERLNEANVKILTHNGKFDYKVLKCTCGYDMPVYWDSYVAARLLDENEPSAGLKQQYIDKIDSNQEKYDIENLFDAKNVEFAVVDPDIFALYSAHDALMTYQLYQWQLEKFKNSTDLDGVKNIHDDMEEPLVEVVADAELEGIDLDQVYAKRLSDSYHKKSEICDAKMEEELLKLQPQIDAWKLSPEANYKTIDKKGKEASKTKLEQLSDPIDLNSPTQLAILFYDILKAPQVSTKSPRGTGVEELTALADKTNWPICDIILEKRTLDKLINTFIDALPKLVSPKDGRIHCQLLPLGTDTGRFSCTSPNLQQIPRANIFIKPMFMAPRAYEEEVETEENLKLNLYDEVPTQRGWVKAKDLKSGDFLKVEEDLVVIKSLTPLDSYILIQLN